MAGRRNYVRVFPADDLQGAALAMLARDLGHRRVFVLDDGDRTWGALSAAGFETAARRLGLDVIGRETGDRRRRHYRDLRDPGAVAGRHVADDLERRGRHGRARDASVTEPRRRRMSAT
jgi:hypothetical protein